MSLSGFLPVWVSSSSKIMTSSTQKTASARASEPARSVFWSIECALYGLELGLETESSDTHLAMMLPGIATVRVCGLPPDGVKTAVGLEVSGSLFGVVGLDSWEVFRFLKLGRFILSAGRRS